MWPRIFAADSLMVKRQGCLSERRKGRLDAFYHRGLQALLPYLQSLAGTPGQFYQPARDARCPHCSAELH
jgi:hypothetical protein